MLFNCISLHFQLRIWDCMKEDFSLWVSQIFLGREQENIREEDRECARKIKEFYFANDDFSILPQSKYTLSKITQVKKTISTLLTFNKILT